jgi:hypothetical protein
MSFTWSEPIGSSGDPDSEFVDAGTQSSAEGANCVYAGKLYSPGANICVDGWEQTCKDGKWEGTGHQCSQPNPY